MKKFLVVFVCLAAFALTGGCSSTAPATGPAVAPTTGSLEITVAGLPNVPAAITVTGPSGFSQTVTETMTLSDLVPGAYTIFASPVVLSNATYTTGGSTTLNVTASLTPVAVSVTYVLANGSLTLTIVGLPAGTNANVSVTGPLGFLEAVMASQTLNNLTPGTSRSP